MRSESEIFEANPDGVAGLFRATAKVGRTKIMSNVIARGPAPRLDNESSHEPMHYKNLRDEIFIRPRSGMTRFGD